MNQNRYHLMHIEQWKEDSAVIEMFIPRIPPERADGEDDTIERVCTSTSIEKCAKAAPHISYVLFGMTEDINLSDMVAEEFHYFLEFKESGMIVRVYHFDVPEHIVTSATSILEKGLVPDVLTTDEHWILDAVQPTAVRYAVIGRNGNEVKILKESETLDGLGVFVRCEVFESYLFETRFSGNDELEKPMSREEAILFKNMIEENYFEELAIAQKRWEQEKKKMVVSHPVKDNGGVHPLQTGNPDLPF